MAVALVDVDGDVDLDLVRAGYSPSLNAALLRNDGAGRFVEDPLPLVVGGSVGYCIATGDLDLFVGRGIDRPLVCNDG